MCGIFGLALSNDQNNSKATLIQNMLNALKSLEYRGYDSAGLAFYNHFDFKEQITVIKCAGRVEALAVQCILLDQDENVHVKKKEKEMGMAHVRWATSSIVNEINAHPHFTLKKEFVVVHNGIVTNYGVLKKWLQSMEEPFVFTSETDTEIIAVLCLYVYQTCPTKTFLEIVQQAVTYIEGSFAILVMSSFFPMEMIATRKGSPLILGVTMDSSITLDNCLLHCCSTFENVFLASDAAAIAPHTSQILYLKDNVWVSIGPKEDSKGYTVQLVGQQYNTMQTLNQDLETISKMGYDSYMLKEIFEQPVSIAQTIKGRLTLGQEKIVLGGLDSHWHLIRKCQRLILIGCGTSHHSCLIVQSVLEQHTQKPVHVELASDFLDRKPPVFRNDVCIFVSQSGETCDTLEALRYCKQQGDCLCVGIVNTVGSTIARETDCGVFLNCGKEVGVASTKAYVCQITALLLVANRFVFSSSLTNGILNIPLQMQELLLHNVFDNVKKIAIILQKEHCVNLLIVGRGQQFATCKEAALKIKEVAYIHTDAIAAGELKHGSVALIDAHVHVFIICTHDDVKVDNALQQLLARNGSPFVVTDDPLFEENYGKKCRGVILVPKAAHPWLQCILNIVPFQLLAYELATLKNFDVDKPRNLAKSVTVA